MAPDFSQNREVLQVPSLSLSLSLRLDKGDGGDTDGNPWEFALDFGQRNLHHIYPSLNNS